MDRIQLKRILISVVLFGICVCKSQEGIFGNNGLSGSALTVAGTNPYQVAILQSFRSSFDVIDGKKFVCSGSLIDSRWVLTAAQCVLNPDLRLMLGVTNIRAYEPFYVNYEIDAGDVVVHPDYNSEKVQNDIALIRLPEPVKYDSHIQPVSLDSNIGDHVNETTFLSGWGRISLFAPVADYLRQTTTTVISNEKCQRQMVRPFFYIRCSHLCTSGERHFSDAGACAEDTGAPLIAFNAKKNRPEQIGIVSKPPFACKGSEPTIYTKVNSYEEWINDVVSRHDGNGSGQCGSTGPCGNS